MDTQKLTLKEQQTLVLCIVKEYLENSELNNVPFEEFLEEIFVERASTEYSEMICKSLVALKEKEYIDGIVEIEYEIEIDENGDESNTDSIDFSMCTFENIDITQKGKNYLEMEAFKDLSKEFFEKAKPVLKSIGLTMLTTTVETFINYGLKKCGIMV